MAQAGIDDLLFHRRRHALEKAALRFGAHGPVGTRGEQERGDSDGAGVGDDPRGRVMHSQQDIDRYIRADQRIVVVRARRLVVVGQPAPADVAAQKRPSAQSRPQPQQRNRKGRIELHAKGRCRQHEPAQRRRIVMDPGAGDHRAEAAGHQRHPFDGNAVSIGNMAREAVEVAHEGSEARRVLAHAWRAAVAARIPGEDRALPEAQFVDQALQRSGMPVAAMDEDEGPAAGLRCRPLPVEQLAAIPAAEDMFGAAPWLTACGLFGAAKRSRKPLAARCGIPVIHCDAPSHGLCLL